ncbi:MAG TPA: aminotransferase class V-fold PLP-dependent enzyme [Thermoanaerobaculia bacterium]|nr:aminotransferase class V-fold PLP-dependent enzyme [Thermoanaerobaculia bacterium]
MPSLTFKIAREARELEQLHTLHYRAFVEEIPQHSPNDDQRHIDRFHDVNTYVVALDGERVIGSIAIRGKRPFSLDEKLPNLDAYVPPGRNLCEFRLLNIEKEYRSGSVLPGLISTIWDYAMTEEYDCALISATTRQLRLYSHLGFVPFGPLVGTDDAQFQPMYLTLEAFQNRAREISSLPPGTRGEVANLLPGPVAIHSDVSAAFNTIPESHRSPTFDEDLRTVKSRLCALAGMRYVEVLLGSGTLSNDTVAAQLSLHGGPGIVISNGEFGERIADQATRARLDFQQVKFAWGEPIDIDAVKRAMDERGAKWVWAVGCETSAGILNDIVALSELCRERDAKLALDCVSAFGAVPLDLTGVWLATAASGKALAAYPGLSMVFHNHHIAPSNQLPRYLDLGMYARDGVPYTHSSNLVRALRVAVERVDWPTRFEQIVTNGAWLRGRLRAAGFNLIGDRATVAPHVVTIQLPEHIRSDDAARALERAGFLLSFASGYLRERNWIQICLMGEIGRDVLPPLIRQLQRILAA